MIRRMLAGAVFVVAACGQSNGGISVGDAWARPTPPGAPTAAFFFTISNPGPPDRLLSVDAAGCEATEIHETTMTDGVMSMREVADGRLELPENAEIVLESGGLHVMCIGVRDDLVASDVVPITLRFATHDAISVDVAVETR